MGSSWYDQIPGVSNVAGVIKGDPVEALTGPAKAWAGDVNGAAGLNNPADISQSPDVAAQRQFRDQLMAQYGAYQPKTEQTVSATPLNTAQSDQARGVAMQNITGLQGVANGTTSTAADALLQRGTDAAARQATGLAAQYSRQNPGAALRMGLAAGNDAAAQAASTMAAQKANEQAQARGQIGTFADAVRGADNTVAQSNQTNDFNTQKANQDANLTQQNTNNQFQLGLANATQNSLGAPVNALQQNQQNQATATANRNQFWGNMLTAGGSAAKLSDRASKKDVKPISLVDALSKHVHGVTYQYKSGMEDEGEHAGVIAQDLEKALPGAVSKGPDGMKRVDTGHTALATVGVVAELAKRLKALEERRA